MPLSRYNYRFEICCYLSMATFILNFPNVELLSSCSFGGTLQLPSILVVFLLLILNIPPSTCCELTSPN